MGFLDLFQPRIKDPIRGTARVVSVSGWPGGTRTTSANIRLQLAVQAEGIQPYAAEITSMCKAEHYPPSGTLPVTVSRGPAQDPDRVE
jgi:hypothetical protein